MTWSERSLPQSAPRSLNTTCSPACDGHSQLVLLGLGALAPALAAALGFALWKSRRRRQDLEDALTRLVAYDPPTPAQ